MTTPDHTILKIEVIDEIAIIRINNPGEKVNTLNETFLNEIESSMEFVNKAPEVKGAVFISTKENCFMAGADVKILQDADTIEKGEEIPRRGQRAFQSIEDCKKPVVAAIHGVCLGGGVEMALGCHYLIATDHPKTVLACPEILLGLFPAGGAPQRLPPRVGIQKALDLMLTGRNIRSKQAKKIGMIDQVVSHWGLQETSMSVCKKLISGELEHKNKTSSTAEKLLEGNPAGRAILFNQARAMIKKKTRGLYPAPFALINAVETGINKGKPAGYEREIKEFGVLTQSTQAKSLISLFFGNTNLKKNSRGKPEKKDSTLAVIGAGQMGAGIGLVSLLKGKEVILKDVNNEGLGRGKKVIWDELNRRCKKRAINSFERDRLMAKLGAQTDLKQFDRVDFVIEAVFEDIDLKHKVIAQLEEVCAEDCIIATNTSAIPIAEVASKAARPENIVGMHYFSPVNKMPLLEVIGHEKNSEQAIARAVQMGLDQGKTVIVVKDSPGFYTTRVLAALMDESILLLQEGIDFKKLDNLMKDFGFPVGPVTLFDEVGIDTAAHISDFLSQRIGSKLRNVKDPILNKLSEKGLYGRKSKKGFFLYEDRPTGLASKMFKPKGKEINPEALEIIQQYSLKNSSTCTDNEIIQMRLAYRFINEALRCMDEGVLLSPVDGDIGAVLGLGFPPMLGGPFHYIDSIGHAHFKKNMAMLEDKFGERFEVSPILNDHLERGKLFHPEVDEGA
ncbi:MAG: fatty acid oxidation complex subunit alpha FadJ [Bacteriovoracaceae bacterium]|nr:fatty acid oxidation complex subunit alpha FadJ [Bacteriovoracaceae bacterium]